MFADDTYITTAHEDISTIECSLNIDLTAVHNWLKTNKLSCKTCKTTLDEKLNFMIFALKTNLRQI